MKGPSNPYHRGGVQAAGLGHTRYAVHRDSNIEIAGRLTKCRFMRSCIMLAPKTFVPRLLFVS